MSNSLLFPYTATLELTNFCNLFCVHCYLEKPKTFSYIDQEKCFDIIDQLYDLGCFKIIFTGGEIFSNKELLFKVIEYAKLKHFQVSLITNFVLVNIDDLNTLKALEVDSINVSIYGNTDDEYSNLCRRKINAAKIRELILYAKKIGLNINVLSILLSFNYESVLEIEKWCRENDILYNTQCILIDNMTHQNMCYMPNDLIMYTYMHKNKFNYQEYVKNKTKEDGKKTTDSCSAGSNRIAISSTGDVYPCINWRIKLGNINDDKLIDIWRSNDILNKIRVHRYSDMECSTCIHFKYCPVCPGVNFSCNDDFKKPAPQICQYAKLINRIINEKD